MSTDARVRVAGMSTPVLDAAHCVDFYTLALGTRLHKPRTVPGSETAQGSVKHVDTGYGDPSEKFYFRLTGAGELVR